MSSSHVMTCWLTKLFRFFIFLILYRCNVLLTNSIKYSCLLLVKLFYIKSKCVFTIMKMCFSTQKFLVYGRKSWKLITSLQIHNAIFVGKRPVRLVSVTFVFSLALAGNQKSFTRLLFVIKTMETFKRYLTIVHFERSTNCN